MNSINALLTSPLLLALSLLICCSTPATARKTLPKSSIGETSTSNQPQVGYDFWGFKEGAPDQVTSLAQTRDGYLWLASPTGLFRFDGQRVERYRPPSGMELISTNVSGLLAPSSGGLWISYRFGGFSFLKDGRLTNYSREAASTGGVRELKQDPNGIVWANTTSGIWRFENSAWQPLGDDWNAPKNGNYMAFDRAGYLWIIAGKSLIYLAPGARRFEVAEQDVKTAGYPHGAGFTFDADGWVVSSQSWRPRSAPASGGPPAYPLLKDHCYVVVDRAGGLWMLYPKLAHVWPAGPAEDSLKAVKIPHVSPDDLMNTWTIAPGNSSSVENYPIPVYTSARLVDHEGNIWFGGTQGLYRFFYKLLVQPALKSTMGPVGIVSDGRGGVWAGGKTSPLFHFRAGQQEIPELGDWRLQAAYLAPDNTVWIGEQYSGFWHETSSKVLPADKSAEAKFRKELFKYTGRRWDFIALPPKVSDQGEFLQAITEDRKGGLWASFGRYGLYRYADGNWTVNGGRNDFPKTIFLSEFTDPAGRVWFGFSGNQLAVLEGDNLRIFGPNDGVGVGNVLAFAGRGPDVWIGGDLGLQRYFNGRLVTINAVDSDMLRGISGIIERANGDLWLNGITGVFHITQAEISRALQDPTHRVIGEHFGRREGLPGYAPQVRPLASAVESTDGRLWFAVNNGVAWLDPNHSRHPPAAIPISIQSVYADDKYYDLGMPLRFPAHTANLNINYVAVSLSAPESVRYRYKLQETDKDWREVRNAEPVTFRNLPPGSYHFVVTTSDTNGAWSDKVANVEFTILPAYYQTSWFRLAMVATGLLLVVGLYRLRLRQATARLNVRFDERLAERTRIARELHDTLLQTVQGSKLVADSAAKSSDVIYMRGALVKLTGWLAQATQEGRAALNSLRTSSEDTKDLAASLQSVAEECVSDSGIAVSFSVLGANRDMHPIARDEIYRIGYESIRNACLHSSASELNVMITYSQDLTLRVSDNGVGMEPVVLANGREGHFGLHGMRERANHIGSKFTLHSSPNSGTVMTLVVPGSIIFRKACATVSTTLFERIRTFVFGFDRSINLQ
ncbi:MAG TPA: triple tyrosine motif-containing protein [Pyrinomonadaceae bacterium]|nr:triple tyrosine motif-containing protein [Pyrinomonadaceae bacterium]